ncbi:uncharacterized protein LOC121810593 [Salvia splendens]|uniref:uncharacterized protein LOC121810593 n=1 Tax=Salvia splendens TaxID=180675 RepID=UPI001C262F40|nr:uncharacterized protein LOC121810593 [Salvia splendens]
MTLYDLIYPHIPTYLIQLKLHLFVLPMSSKVDTMEPFHTLLDDLQLTKTNSIIKVRCIHVYEVAAPRDKTNIVSLECVLHDRMGTRIQATIPRILHAKFGALIREGDIIGVVVDTGKIVTHSTYRLIETRLSDSDHNMLFCTLWGDVVDSYLQQLEGIKGEIPIIIVQFCKPTLFRGTIRVRTHFNISSVYINQDIDEISKFKERISGDVAFLSQESIYRFTDTRVSNEFDGLVVKTLADVQEDVDGSYWICGRIEDVECHYGQWSYMACKQCVKKVVKVKNGFNCEECDNSDGIAIPRFRFIVNVVDGSSNASLLLWDRECVQLLGKKVDEIQLGHEELGADKYIPPKIEEKLLGQTLLFRIHVKTSNEYWIDKPYTVNKICNDPQIVDKYIPPTLDSRGSNSGLEISPTLEGLSPFVGTDVVLHGSTSGANDTHTKLIAKDSLKISLDVEILGQTIVVGGEQKKLMIKLENN